MRHTPLEGIPRVPTPRNQPAYIDDGQNFEDLDPVTEQAFLKDLLSEPVKEFDNKSDRTWEQVRDLKMSIKRTLEPDEEYRLFRYYNYLRHAVATGATQVDTLKKIGLIEQELIIRNVGIILSGVRAAHVPSTRQRWLAVQIAVVQFLSCIRSFDYTGRHGAGRIGSYFAFDEGYSGIAKFIRTQLQRAREREQQHKQIPSEAILDSFLPIQGVVDASDTGGVDWDDLEQWLFNQSGIDQNLIRELIYGGATLEEVGAKKQRSRERVRQQKEDTLNILFIEILKYPDQFASRLEELGIPMVEGKLTEASESVLLEELITAAELSDRDANTARLYLERALHGGNYTVQLKAINMTGDHYKSSSRNAKRKLIQAARTSPNPWRYRELVLLLVEDKRGR